jgi:hypothetical protein
VTIIAFPLPEAKPPPQCRSGHDAQASLCFAIVCRSRSKGRKQVMGPESISRWPEWRLESAFERSLCRYAERGAQPDSSRGLCTYRTIPTETHAQPLPLHPSHLSLPVLYSEGASRVTRIVELPLAVALSIRSSRLPQEGVR